MKLYGRPIPVIITIMKLSVINLLTTSEHHRFPRHGKIVSCAVRFPRHGKTFACAVRPKFPRHEKIVACAVRFPRHGKIIGYVVRFHRCETPRARHFNDKDKGADHRGFRHTWRHACMRGQRGETHRWSALQRHGRGRAYRL